MINKLIPETLSTKTLRLVYGGSIPRPKFPARYSWCFATSKVDAMLSDIGFGEIRIMPSTDITTMIGYRSCVTSTVRSVID